MMKTSILLYWIFALIALWLLQTPPYAPPPYLPPVTPVTPSLLNTTIWQIFIATLPQIFISLGTLVATIIGAWQTLQNRKTLVDESASLRVQTTAAAIKADIAAKKADDIHTTVQNVQTQAKEIKLQTDSQLSHILAKYEESQMMLAKMMAILAAREGTPGAVRIEDVVDGKQVPPLSAEDQGRRKNDK